MDELKELNDLTAGVSYKNTIEKSKPKRGNLKIFLGYTHGTGKTYSMLEAAYAAKEEKTDVVVGYINPNTYKKTKSLMDGLEVIPLREIEYKGIIVHEFDIDKAIERKPQLIIIDELAHTNVVGCRHKKRYKDIEELLNSGIDVYTTLNIENIESLSDTIASIMNYKINERIEDYVFEQANQIEIIDIDPQELIKRFNTEKLYKETKNQYLEKNFTLENLKALRDITLRRCSERINLLKEKHKFEKNINYYKDEHILVCLSSSPSNSKIIRTAARMATSFGCAFTAIYVETPNYLKMKDSDKKRLKANMQLAQKLGAKIETVYGDDVVYQITEFARLSGISRIVIGKSPNQLFKKITLTEKLALNAQNVDIHIIPEAAVSLRPYHEKKAGIKAKFVFSYSDILKSAVILLIASMIGILFQKLNFAESNIIMVYVLGALVASIVTTNQIYSLVTSIVSVLIFNFLFTEPKFTFQAYNQGYPVTFLIMFIVSFITGSLAVRLKNHAKKLAQSAFRTKVLLDTNQILQKVVEREDIISATANQLLKLLDKNIIFYPEENGTLGEPFLYFKSDDCGRDEYVSKDERAVAMWVFKNNTHAGATTKTLSNSRCLYLAVRINEEVYGVVGIVIDNKPLDSFENSILLSIIGECALSLENEKHAREKEEAAILAKNEQLRANLLRAISHDLRTPLTSISGNASNLLYNDESFDRETKIQLYADIYDDSMWLINLVENLLSVTRLEEGHLNLKITDDLIDDVITEALRHINRKSAEHHIEVKHEDEFLLAKMDARLIVQVVINIVDNAIKYTQPGSHITITTKRENDKAVISIADDGEGISNEMKARVFDMFYTGADKISDSRRSLGLGLSLCRSIIHAHNGEISVYDNLPHGTIFTFTLPVGEVHLHE